MKNSLVKKNIFYQNQNKDKHNPDVILKKKEFETTRRTPVFKKSEVTYNSITNQVPNTIKSQRDLELLKDKPLPNINNMINNKEKERKEQDNLYKPIKQKILTNKDDTVIPIQNFNELRDEQNSFLKEQKNTIINNKNKYENILGNLKNLGILN
jgi:hypothetical protein